MKREEHREMKEDMKALKEAVKENDRKKINHYTAKLMRRYNL